MIYVAVLYLIQQVKNNKTKWLLYLNRKEIMRRGMFANFRFFKILFSFHVTADGAGTSSQALVKRLEDGENVKPTSKKKAAPKIPAEFVTCDLCGKESRGERFHIKVS